MLQDFFLLFFFKEGRKVRNLKDKVYCLYHIHWRGVYSNLKEEKVVILIRGVAGGWLDWRIVEHKIEK